MTPKIETAQAERELRRRGRPKTFDRDAALDGALRVFWKQGYAATSMDEIARETGTAKPALYKAFGDKAGLMAEALRTYFVNVGTKSAAALTDQDDLLDALRAHLMATIDGFGAQVLTNGCMLTNATVSLTEEDETLAHAVRDLNDQGFRMVRDRMAKAQNESQLGPEADLDALAHYIRSQSYGLAVLARAGVPEEDLRRQVDIALAAIPVRRRS